MRDAKKKAKKQEKDKKEKDAKAQKCGLDEGMEFSYCFSLITCFNFHLISYELAGIKV